MKKTEYSLARNAAVNAMRISECLPEGAIRPGAFPTSLFDRVAESGVAMAEAERAPGFDWGEAQVDWESACQKVADLVNAADGVTLTAKQIRAIANGDL